MAENTSLQEEGSVGVEGFSRSNLEPSDYSHMLETWQDYYAYAQQLYEAGDEEAAESYYAVAQQMYEASDDVIEGHTGTSGETEAEVPFSAGSASSAFSQAHNYNDINTVTPSMAPPPPEAEISESSLDSWAAEARASMTPEELNPNKGSAKNKVMVGSIIGVVAAIVVGLGIYLHMNSGPTVVKAGPPSGDESAFDPSQYSASKPSARKPEWDKSRHEEEEKSGKRRRPRGGDQKDDEGTDLSKGLADDPLAGFKLEE